MKTKRKRSASQLPSTSGNTSNASLDALDVESDASQKCQIGPNEKWIQCSGCQKKIQEKSILLHLRSKKCKQHYSDKEYSDLLSKRDEVRRGYEVQRKKAKSNPESNVSTMPDSNVATNTSPNQGQQNQPDPAENWIQCKGCPKKMLEKSILLHLRSKNCRKHYSDMEYSKLIIERDERKRCAKRQYKSTKKSVVQVRQTRMNNKNNMTSDDRLLLFKRDIVDGPNFVCFSCNRTLFKNQVKILNSKDIAKLLTKLDENLIDEVGLGGIGDKVELIFCHSCSQKINKKKLPSMNINNGLKLDDVPYELSSMSDLEQQLIAQLLLFVKIKKLPKTRMGAVEGKVISVPIECQDISRYILIIKLFHHYKALKYFEIV